MMIREVEGNILDTTATAVVNPVNTQGVMGAGLAKQLKLRYPDMFARYHHHCTSGRFRIGMVLTIRVGLDDPQYVICFPTKQEWWKLSRLSYIEAGLAALHKELHEYGIPRVAIPALGCGWGGLDWAVVRDLIYEHLGNASGLDIELYTPRGRDL